VQALVGGNIAGIENDDVFNGCNGKGEAKKIGRRVRRLACGSWRRERGQQHRPERGGDGSHSAYQRVVQDVAGVGWCGDFTSGPSRRRRKRKSGPDPTRNFKI
jgi:hypothetical protein